MAPPCQNGSGDGASYQKDSYWWEKKKMKKRKIYTLNDSLRCKLKKKGKKKRKTNMWNALGQEVEIKKKKLWLSLLAAVAISLLVARYFTMDAIVNAFLITLT